MRKGRVAIRALVLIHACLVTGASAQVVFPIVNSLRPTLGPDQGYLAFVKNGPLPLGEERTGWTDARHPARDGTRDNKRGYDYSNFSVNVATHNVTDLDGDMGIANVPASRIRNDFDVANAAYAQMGLSVFHAGNNNVNGNDIAPNNMSEQKLSQLFGVGRNANAINAYYVNSLPARPGFTTFGQALPPVYASRGGSAGAGNNTGAIPPGTAVYNDGFAVQDNFRNDTWAHELGHFLLDTNRFGVNNDFHSAVADELMAAGGTPRTIPSLTPKEGAADATGVTRYGVRDSGQMNAPLGSVSHFNVNTHPLGVGTATKQGTAMHTSPSILHQDRGDFAGDHADYDWIEDSWALEDLAGGADNHPGNRENLYFVKGALGAESHAGHDHDTWGSLGYNAFAGNTFRFADVISGVGRYVDMDVKNGAWSREASALDYVLEFSADGSTWVAGVPVAAYRDGWNLATDSEDYLARWMSPVDATTLRIRAIFTGVDGHDGNTQIDAVIVSTLVPEPGALAVFGAGMPLAMRRRRSV